jgi:anthranilate phosphoribosyltransferase
MASGSCSLFNTTRNQTTVQETLEDRRVIAESGSVVAGEGGTVNISTSDPQTIAEINRQTVGTLQAQQAQALRTIENSVAQQLQTTAAITGQALQQTQAVTEAALNVRREANQSVNEGVIKAGVNGVAIVAIAFGIITLLSSRK